MTDLSFQDLTLISSGMQRPVIDNRPLNQRVNDPLPSLFRCPAAWRQGSYHSTTFT